VRLGGAAWRCALGAVAGRVGGWCCADRAVTRLGAVLGPGGVGRRLVLVLVAWGARSVYGPRRWRFGSGKNVVEPTLALGGGLTC